MKWPILPLSLSIILTVLVSSAAASGDYIFANQSANTVTLSFSYNTPSENSLNSVTLPPGKSYTFNCCVGNLTVTATVNPSQAVGPGWHCTPVGCVVRMGSAPLITDAPGTYTLVRARRPPVCASNPQVVSAAYRQIFQRAPDPGGLAHYTGLLQHGWTVRQMLADMCVQREYVNRFVVGKNPAEIVNSLYERLLNRQLAIGESGYQLWQRVLQSNGLKAVVNGILNSPEYNQKFGDQRVPGQNISKC